MLTLPHGSRLEVRPVVGPTSRIGNVRLSEITPLVQVIQPAIGRERGFEPRPAQAQSQALTNTLRVPSAPFGFPWASARPEVWAVFPGRENSLQRFQHHPQLQAPWLKEEGLDVCRTRCQAAGEGVPMTGPKPPSKALLEGVSRSQPQAWGPGLPPPPCSVHSWWGHGQRARSQLRSHQSFPTLAWATFVRRTGPPVLAELQGREQRSHMRDAAEPSARAPQPHAKWHTGVACGLFRVDTGPRQQALQPSQTAEAEG